MVVAYLAEQLLMRPEDTGSNPAIGSILGRKCSFEGELKYLLLMQTLENKIYTTYNGKELKTCVKVCVGLSEQKCVLLCVRERLYRQ